MCITGFKTLIFPAQLQITVEKTEAQRSQLPKVTHRVTKVLFEGVCISFQRLGPGLKPDILGGPVSLQKVC